MMGGRIRDARAVSKDSSDTQSSYGSSDLIGVVRGDPSAAEKGLLPKSRPQDVAAAIRILRTQRCIGIAKLGGSGLTWVSIVTLCALLTAHFSRQFSRDQDDFNHTLLPLFNRTCAAIYNISVVDSTPFCDSERYFNFSRPISTPHCRTTANDACEARSYKIWCMAFAIGTGLAALPLLCISRSKISSWFKFKSLSESDFNAVKGPVMQLLGVDAHDPDSLSTRIRQLEEKARAREMQAMVKQDAGEEEAERSSSLCCC